LGWILSVSERLPQDDAKSKVADGQNFAAAKKMYEKIFTSAGSVQFGHRRVQA